ncbi:ShlB/FhaC/HecB family hemolysin secretion/activation protein [Burkholderia ubonensis]|uniref:ShlB/FhaC/HecB family hemolysin secretion/activation protein n=1 Tax=Burkholderia ubonensis TaxID=101571 RepID=UPI0009B35B85|nr:ShlB/FhaC/HecB family hemolysin secretion/activation protein [Burkholderia ubonensis]
MIENQQRERLREDQERALRSPPASDSVDLNAIKPPVSVPDLGVPCRDIQRIELTGDTVNVPAALRAQVTQDYAGRCLGVSDIEAILSLFTKSFIERGFVTTRVYLPAQDLRSGRLVVTIVAGKIENYIAEGDRGRSIWLRGAFPASPGDLLNLRDLEQGIDQINRLGSNDARLDLRPGSQPGQSIVAVINEGRFPLHLFTSTDNLGANATGRNGLSATVTADSLLGLNEMLALTRRQSAFPFDGAHRSDSTALNVQLPVGYSTFSLNLSQSNYTNTLTLPSGISLVATGRVDSWSIGADRVIYRDRGTRMHLSATLGMMSSKNWLDGQFLQVSSRKLSFLSVGVSGFTHAFGGAANARVGVVRGLSWFGGLRDASDLPDDLPHAQATKFTLEVGYDRRFRLGGVALVWSAQGSVQRALDTLYGSQQILIGGPSTVRGFLNSSLTGDNGYYVRNELSLPWRLDARWLGALSGRAYTGFDWGNVTNRAADVPSGSLAGVTLGLGLNWKGSSLDASLARAVRAPSALMREGTLCYLRLSTAF